MLGSIITLIWILSIVAAAGCAKLNKLSVMWWTLGAVFAGPLVFVPLGLWIDRLNDKS